MKNLLLIAVILLIGYFLVCACVSTEKFTNEDTQLVSDIYNYIKSENEVNYANYLQFLVDKKNVYKNLNNHDVYFTFRTLNKLRMLNLDTIKKELA